MEPREPRAPHIGTLGEGPLHAALKQLVAEPGARYETPVEGLVVDVVNPGQLVEVQTRGLGRLKPKLERLLPAHPLRIVLPLAQEKLLVKAAEEEHGLRELSRRRSPRRATPPMAFAELVGIADWLLHPNLTLELWLTREEELRVLRAGKAWRRKGWVVLERRLLEVLEVRGYHGRAAWAAWIPFPPDEEFDTAQLAEAWQAPRWTAQKACYTLTRAGVLVRQGKRGRNQLYQLAAEEAPEARKA